MNRFWYTLLVRVAGLCGSWLFVLISRIIATGYFVFSPRVSESLRFYAILFPARGRLYHLGCAFRQYQNFTTIHLDRFLAGRAESATLNSQGMAKLDAVIGKNGGILLMSHLGNWEIAATLLKKQRKDLQLLLYMGVKEKEGVERLQKDDLRRSGVTIIGVDQEANSPFSAVETLRVLRSGGLVSIAGDIVWRSDQRTVRVNFLGGDAYLPEAPFIFAMLSGAPLFIFFAFRTGRNNYQVFLSDPLFVEAKCRRDRPGVIAKAAQQYADLLQKALHQHPCEWYHFDRFIL
jgi:predicted LPLAT superfamily acyltransferase